MGKTENVYSLIIDLSRVFDKHMGLDHKGGFVGHIYDDAYMKKLKKTIGELADLLNIKQKWVKWLLKEER